MAPPFRADHIGSLLRPEALLRVRERSHADDVTSSSAQQAAREEQRRAIAEVVKQQVERGITPITSGEYEREIFYGGLFDQLAGFENQYFTVEQYRPGFPTARKMRELGMQGREVSVATGKVKYEKSAYLDDWLYLRSLLPQERWGDAKMTIPTPAWHHMQLPNGKAYAKGVYSSEEEFLTDVSAAVRQEILTLYDAGLRVIQVDDPNMSFFCDQEFVDTSKQVGSDLDALLELYIGAHNAAIRNLPSDLQVGVHLCRGNLPQGAHIASGGYDKIARKMFRQLNYRFYCLEFDSPRAGGFEPLKELPVDKAVVLGVVTTKFAELENLEELRQRVFRAADMVAEGQGRTRKDALRDNLAVSPQCGFSSSARASGLGVDMEVMWKKLALVKKLATSIWESG